MRTTRDMSESPSEKSNNLVVAGAVLALLFHVEKHLTSLEPVVDEAGNPTNQIDIGLEFMNSKYRLTVERVKKDD